jgi:hypothetical protein
MIRPGMLARKAEDEAVCSIERLKEHTSSDITAPALKPHPDLVMTRTSYIPSSQDTLGKVEAANKCRVK